MTNVVSMNDHLQKTWDAYVSAREIAEATRKLEDGVAAGKAWRRWLDLYMTTEQRSYLGARASA